MSYTKHGSRAVQQVVVPVMPAARRARSGGFDLPDLWVLNKVAVKSSTCSVKTFVDMDDQTPHYRHVP